MTMAVTKVEAGRNKRRADQILKIAFEFDQSLPLKEPNQSKYLLAVVGE